MKKDRTAYFKKVREKQRIRNNARDIAIVSDQKRESKERIYREVDYILYGIPDQITDKRPRTIKNGLSVGGFGK